MKLNTNLNLKLIGLEPLLMPFLSHISSQRAVMCCGHLSKIVQTDGAEFPQIFTGYESIFGDYEFNTAEFNQDIQILDIIPRFHAQFGEEPIDENPEFTIIYVGNDNNEVNYFNISSYTALKNGFGYMNKMVNRHLLNKNQYVSKGTKFYTSPAHVGEEYHMGVNANAIFATQLGNTEDATIISKSLANKLEHTAIASLQIPIMNNMIPLNLYGSVDQYKIMPDIGQDVRDDGVLIAFRDINKKSKDVKAPPSLLSDINNDRLRAVEYSHDEVYYADRPGATIIDVQVHCNPACYKHIKGDYSPYRQLVKYQEHWDEYCRKIHETYLNIKNHSMYKIGSNFTNLVFKSIGLNVKNDPSGRKWKPTVKKVPIEYINLKITYMYKRKVSLGFKLTGSDGNKGVVSAIWDDEDMPMDEQGFRADIIIGPFSNYNRMNPGQLYQQFYNRASDIVAQRALAMPHKKGLAYILEYIHDIHPEYAELIVDTLKNHDLELEFMESVRKNSIRLLVIPGLKTINDQHVLFISTKYDITQSHVSYNIPMKDGSKLPVVSDKPGLIGKKYIYLLEKLPEDQLQAVEFGYVSHFNVPLKISSSASKLLKAQSPVGRTPIRFGGDETAILAMSCGVAPVARMIGVHGNSPEAVNNLMMRLLTDPNPTQLGRIDMSNEEISKSNKYISMLAHQLGCAGVDLYGSTDHVPEVIVKSK